MGVAKYGKRFTFCRMLSEIILKGGDFYDIPKKGCFKHIMKIALIVDIVGIVFTVISIIVTVISIYTTKKDKNQKSNRTSQS